MLVLPLQSRDFFVTISSRFCTSCGEVNPLESLTSNDQTQTLNFYVNIVKNFVLCLTSVIRDQNQMLAGQALEDFELLLTNHNSAQASAL